MRIPHLLARSAFAMMLSMSAMPALVNGQAPALTTINNGKASKDTKARMDKIIALTLENGSDGSIGANLAPVIGLSKSMPMRTQEITLTERADGFDKRAFF